MTIDIAAEASSIQFTVTIPAFNEEAHLAATLASIPIATEMVPAGFADTRIRDGYGRIFQSEALIPGGHYL